MPGKSVDVAGVPRLHQFLQLNQEPILALWEEQNRRWPEAQRLAASALRDHLPALLEQIAERVQSLHGEDGASLEGVATTHALERLDYGFDLQWVTRELALLRSIILEQWSRQIAGEPAGQVLQEIRALDAAVDEVFVDSVQAYSKARERTLVALERISAAALGTGDLRTFLPKLLKVLLETTAAADMVKLFLRKGDTLELGAAEGLLSAEQDQPSHRMGEGFAGAVAQAGAPRLLSNASDDPLVKDPGIRSRRIRALYGVPLIHEGAVIGVAEMGSCTAYDFSSDDKQLFRAMVQRATSIIAQAQLIEREHRAHAEAAESLALLRALVAASPVGVAVLDRELRYVLVNEPLAKLSGRAQEAYPGKRIDEVLPPEHAKAAARLVRQVLETGQPVLNLQAEVRSPSRPGTTSLLTNLFPIATPDGSLLGVGAAVIDLTELKEFQRRAADSEERFRTLADNIPQLAWMADEAGNIFWFNRRWYEFTGSSPDQANESTWQRFYHPDHVARVTAKFREHLATGEPWEDTFPLRSKDGTYRWFLSRALPVRDAQGKVVRWFGTNTDITAQRAVENALRESRDFERHLIGIVSHDLRSPLTAILMAASTLLRRDNLDNRMRTSLERILSSGNRASRLIRDLLDFAQARNAGTLPVHRRALHLGSFVTQVVEEIKLGHPGREIRVQESGDTQGYWDADRMAQIVTNLVGNAVEHSPADTAVDVTIHGEEEQICLRVHNGGRPIPEEELESLFNPYRRGAESGRSSQAGGIGLGLFITKMFVDAKGGRIEVHSAQGEGTTFTVWLPKRPASPPSGQG